MEKRSARSATVCDADADFEARYIALVLSHSFEDLGPGYAEKANATGVTIEHVRDMAARMAAVTGRALAAAAPHPLDPRRRRRSLALALAFLGRGGPAMRRSAGSSSPARSNTKPQQMSRRRGAW